MSAKAGFTVYTLYINCRYLSWVVYFVFSPKGSDCGLVNVNIPTSGAEIGGAFGECLQPLCQEEFVLHYVLRLHS